MSELVKGSTELTQDAAATDAAALLRQYSFDLDTYTIEQLLTYWLETYPVNWVRLAVIEALYQGRYKAISVEQILALWQRRQQPLYHFNHEFERLVSGLFPRSLGLPGEATSGKTLSRDSGVISYAPDPITQDAATKLEAAPESQSTTPESASELEQQPIPISPPPLGQPSPSCLGHTPPMAAMSSVEETIDLDSLEHSATESATDPAFPPAEAVSLDSSHQDAPVPNSMSILQLLGSQILIPGLGLNTPALKPKLRLHLASLYQPNWAIGVNSHHPIDQFTPKASEPNFYSKFKVAAPPEEEQPDE